ncbi:hypothetical protein NG895_16655 [Aeoliella sp. ICT_H6.2]|uniref:PEP-CTERM sorting domain-containing protein n=1 Tax=Aeoliella straminimaris TaxID=2954799 RepID=A0A9X2FFV6_9BACT|nr:hypothetical protein [Aeoliella straminimaris]MCO6045544.1 hypothetical protein [Aeoliella straminimaris]
MKQLVRLMSLAIVLQFGVCAPNSMAAPVVIDFDSLTPGALPGDVLIDHGVTFVTCNTPNGLTVGSVFSINDPLDEFQVEESINGPLSPPNLAFARDRGYPGDLLMQFVQPVTNVGLFIDIHQFEPGDLVRLVALESTGTSGEFRVLELDDAIDNAIGGEANHLQVGGGIGSFSYALFQVTSETDPEGIDNLSFTFVPEPSSITLLCLIFAAAARSRTAAVASATLRSACGFAPHVRVLLLQ